MEETWKDVVGFKISAAKINNLPDSHISQCCNGKRKSCGGYKWKRIMEDKFNE